MTHELIEVVSSGEVGWVSAVVGEGEGRLAALKDARTFWAFLEDDAGGLLLGPADGRLPDPAPALLPSLRLNYADAAIHVRGLPFLPFLSVYCDCRSWWSWKRSSLTGMPVANCWLPAFPSQPPATPLVGSAPPSLW